MLFVLAESIRLLRNYADEYLRRARRLVSIVKRGSETNHVAREQIALLLLTQKILEIYANWWKRNPAYAYMYCGDDTKCA